MAKLIIASIKLGMAIIWSIVGCSHYSGVSNVLKSYGEMVKTFGNVPYNYHGCPPLRGVPLSGVPLYTQIM